LAALLSSLHRRRDPWEVAFGHAREARMRRSSSRAQRANENQRAVLKEPETQPAP